MIEYNPIYKKNGSLNGAITTAPSNSLVFDLAGKAIWAKGVKLKGTDHTYTFSHDNYITLTNTPGSDESEDIKIGVNITALKAAIDTTYSVVTASSNGLAPMFSSGNLANTDNTDHYYLGITGSTLKWYKNAYRQLKVGDNVVLGVTDRDPLQIVSADSNLSVTWNNTNKQLVIKNEKPAIGDLTDINVSQFRVIDNTNYRLLFKGTANDNNYTGVSRFSEYLLFNPSTKLLTIDGIRVITAADIYVGATSAVDAIAGLVPTATSAQRTYFLRGDGVWTAPANTWRPIQVSGSEKLSEATNTGALNFVAGTGIEVSWDTTNKRIVITNSAPDVNHNTDSKVTQVSTSVNYDYPVILKGSNNLSEITTSVNFSQYLLFNPSTKLLKVNGQTVIHTGNINSANATISDTLTTIATLGGVEIKAKVDYSNIIPSYLSQWDITVDKAAFELTREWADAGVGLQSLSPGPCLLYINYCGVHYSGTFSYTGTTINTDDEFPLHESGYRQLERGRIFAKIAAVSGVAKLMLSASVPESNIPLFTIKIKQIAIL